MSAASLLAPDGRAVVVAIDHPLYSWPVGGLEAREELIGAVVAAGADGLIASYGTLRDCADAFGGARRILKLDLTRVTVNGVGGGRDGWTVAWTLDDAQRVGAEAVMTLVELGTPAEMQALSAAARVAVAADRAGLPYVCEIMPVAGGRHPDPFDPELIAAGARAAAELGAHVVKTSMPVPASGVSRAVTCGLPVLLAGGEPAEPGRLVADVRAAIAAGGAGAAFGRNVWGGGDPEGMVRALCRAVHGDGARG